MQSGYLNLSPYFSLPPADMMCGGSPLKSAEGFEFYSSGRAAVLALKSAEGGGKRALHVPHFFCPAVAEFFAAHFEVKNYEHIPSEALPRFETIRAKGGDIVMAVNFYGIFDSAAWANWKASNMGVTLLEDHSHAPFSLAALHPAGDYSFASLRKYAPACGAYLNLKGRGARALFNKGCKGMNLFEAKILSAQALKFLQSGGADMDSSKIFETFEDAENMLCFNPENPRISEYSLDMARRFCVSKASALRRENFLAFSETLARFKNLPFEVLNCPLRARAIFKPQTDEDYFYPVLLFNDIKARNLCRARLNAMGAELPVYWAALRANASEVAKDFSRRVLGIPLDYRSAVDFAREAAQKIARIFFAEE